MRSIFKLLLLLAIFSCFAFAQNSNDRGKRKLTADELLAKHVASIGTPEAIAAAKSRILVGYGALSGGVGSVGRVAGPAQFASQGDMFLWALILNSNDYRYEKVAYDGKNLSTGRPFGTNTDLGEFIRAHPVIAKRGLFGGVLSAAWPLLTLEKGEKLESISATTNNEVEVYKAKYSSSANGQLSVTLHFDAETFRHVMTEYKYNVPPRQGGPILSGLEKPTYYSMIETFSNFKRAGDLTLPMTHQINVSVNAPTGVTSLQWMSVYSQVVFDQEIDATQFKVS